MLFQDFVFTAAKKYPWKKKENSRYTHGSFSAFCFKCSILFWTKTSVNFFRENQEKGEWELLKDETWQNLGQHNSKRNRGW